MNTVIGERCSGKTTRLIKKSAETGAVIVTATVMMADYIKDTARRMNLEIPSPISATQLLNLKHGRRNTPIDGLLLEDIHKRGILIDEAQIVLQNIFSGCLIDEITLTDLGDNVERLKKSSRPDNA